MAKNRRPPNYFRGIRNGHLIGAGNKFVPVYKKNGKINWRNSVRNQGISGIKTHKFKLTQKNFASRLRKPNFKSQQPIRTKTQLNRKDNTKRLQGIERLKKQIAKTAPTPSTKMKMKSRTPARKPPTKGR